MSPIERFFEGLTTLTIYGFVVSIVLGILYSLSSVVFASGNVTSCYYIKNTIDNPVGEPIEYYNLMGSVDWRSDVQLGKFKSIDELTVFSKIQRCPLK
jgi:hypothetical protein